MNHWSGRQINMLMVGAPCLVVYLGGIKDPAGKQNSSDDRDTIG